MKAETIRRRNKAETSTINRCLCVGNRVITSRNGTRLGCMLESFVMSAAKDTEITAA